uniref:Uncharacterized protein n=1 Tax=Meloidogyne enterolobii TaxID=390850 RepID=A0A6V7W5Q3_MELEN|nr:unnamed protein product [Meloidogyne enterolobii]
MLNKYQPFIGELSVISSAFSSSKPPTHFQPLPAVQVPEQHLVAFLFGSHSF